MKVSIDKELPDSFRVKLEIFTTEKQLVLFSEIRFLIR